MIKFKLDNLNKICIFQIYYILVINPEYWPN